MGAEGRLTLGELGRRMSVLEEEVDELRELVDGQESWSHRKRLHALEDDKRAAELVAQALTDFHELRSAKSTRIREWGSFAVALAAVCVALFAMLHGYHVHPAGR